MLRAFERYFWNKKLKRELRDHQVRSTKPTLGLISTVAEYVPSVDTAHYSVRRYDAVLNRWVYATWNWGLARGVFACNVVKASDGIIPDPFYDEHVATMQAAGAFYGSYHFFRDNANAITQEGVFSSKCNASGGYGFVVAIDCETITGSNQAYISSLGSFANELKKHYFGPVIIYSRSSFWEPIWVGAGSPAWTTTLPQWQALYPTSLQTDTARRSILYDGFVPSFPTYKMRGLGQRWGWQWTSHITNTLIPGHNLVKAEEDGNLWLRSTIPAPAPPPPPPLTLESLDVRITRLERALLTT